MKILEIYGNLIWCPYCQLKGLSKYHVSQTFSHHAVLAYLSLIVVFAFPNSELRYHVIIMKKNFATKTYKGLKTSATCRSFCKGGSYFSILEYICGPWGLQADEHCPLFAEKLLTARTIGLILRGLNSIFQCQSLYL